MKTASRVLVSLFVFGTFFGNASSQDKDEEKGKDIKKLTEHELAAKDFSFDGIDFNTTLEQFKKKFPLAQKQEEDKKVGSVSYYIASKKSTGMGCYFFEGKLVEMRVLYEADKIAKFGGIEVFFDRVKKKFGVASDVSSSGEGTPKLEYVFTWEFKNADRKIGVLIKLKHTRIDVINTVVKKKFLEKKKKTADIGF